LLSGHRESAAVLFLSSMTTECHLRNIWCKLDLRSPIQLVGIVLSGEVESHQPSRVRDHEHPAMLRQLVFNDERASQSGDDRACLDRIGRPMKVKGWAGVSSGICGGLGWWDRSGRRWGAGVRFGLAVSRYLGAPVRRRGGRRR
jgi:hypothetical protein